MEREVRGFQAETSVVTTEEIRRGWGDGQRPELERLEHLNLIP